MLLLLNYWTVAWGFTSCIFKISPWTLLVWTSLMLLPQQSKWGRSLKKTAHSFFVNLIISIKDITQKNMVTDIIVALPTKTVEINVKLNSAARFFLWTTIVVLFLPFFHLNCNKTDNEKLCPGSSLREGNLPLTKALWENRGGESLTGTSRISYPG